MPLTIPTTDSHGQLPANGDFTLACCRFQSRDGPTLPPRNSPDLTRPPVVLAHVVPANPPLALRCRASSTGHRLERSRSGPRPRYPSGFLTTRRQIPTKHRRPGRIATLKKSPQLTEYSKCTPLYELVPADNDDSVPARHCRRSSLALTPAAPAHGEAPESTRNCRQPLGVKVTTASCPEDSPAHICIASRSPD